MLVAKVASETMRALIGYDLHPSKGESYESLYQAIKKLGRWFHILDSTWLVDTTMDEIAIRNALKPHIYDDDQLIVFDVSDCSWAARGFSKSGYAWLNGG